MIVKYMDMCTLITGYRPVTFTDMSKIDILMVDETKHVLNY